MAVQTAIALVLAVLLTLTGRAAEAVGRALRRPHRQLAPNGRTPVVDLVAARASPRGEGGRQVPLRGRLRRRAGPRRREEQHPADPGRRRRQARHRPRQHPPGRGQHRLGRAPAAGREPYFEVGEFGTPGDYRAFFIPTAPGSYSFHFTGTIKGQKVDQTFKSGPQSFSDIEDPAQVQYPVQQPAGGQLATRADRETARVNAALTAERDQAKDDAASARTLAIIGLVVAILGLVAGGVALARGHRPAAPDAGAPAPAPADTTVRS